MSGFLDISGGDGGVYKKVIKEGSGVVPSSGDEVRAHYTGTLDDGTVFDSSVKRGREFKFTIGVNHVIRGWVSFESIAVWYLCCLSKFDLFD